MLNRCSSVTPRHTSRSLAENLARRWFPVRHASKGKKTHYDTLELSKNATQKEIKSSFYRLSMKHHPDKNIGKDGAAEQFREVSDAYQVLSNAESKQQYDSELGHGSNTTSAAGRTQSRKTYNAGAASYRARPPPPTGRSKAYNFDEFYRMHYGQVFKERELKREDAELRRSRAEYFEEGQSGALIVVLFIVVVVCADELFQEYQAKPPDKPDKPD